MTRCLLVLALGGCTVTVDSDAVDGSRSTSEPSDSSDPTDPGDPGSTDPDPTDPDPTDPTDPDPTDPASCDGWYAGTYDGTERGTFDAEVVTDEMRMYVYDVEQSGFLDGYVEIEDDGAMYGEEDGVWMAGTLDWDSCTMSGDWGAVVAPGVPLGSWEIE